MFERYVEESRRVIFFARYEALCQDAFAISAAHILIGLTREVGSRADVIASLKENEAKLREIVAIPCPQTKLTEPKLSREIPLDDKSKMVLEYAARESQSDDAYWIGTDHLLRGILSFPNEASTALRANSMDLATARLASRNHRAEFPDKKSIYYRIFGSPFRAHRGIYIKLLSFIAVCVLGTLLIRWLN